MVFQRIGARAFDLQIFLFLLGRDPLLDPLLDPSVSVITETAVMCERREKPLSDHASYRAIPIRPESTSRFDLPFAPRLISGREK